MQRLSIARRSGGSVGAAVVAFGVGAAVSGSFAARGSVGAAVVAFGVGAAVSGAFAACGSVGAAVVAFGVGAAVSGSFAAAAEVVMSSSLSGMVILPSVACGCVLPRSVQLKPAVPHQTRTQSTSMSAG